jgi:hypothetical protein
VVLVFRDVTESYVQEKRIRENEKLLKNITDNVPGVVFQIKSDATHTYSLSYVSAKATRVFGLNTDLTTFFENFSAYIPENEKDCFATSIRDAVDRVITWDYQGRFI